MRPASVNANLFRLSFWAAREGDGEHSILDARFDSINIDILRNGEGTTERAAFGFACDIQDAVFETYVYLRRAEARYRHFDIVAALGSRDLTIRAVVGADVLVGIKTKKVVERGPGDRLVAWGSSGSGESVCICEHVRQGEGLLS